MDRISQDFAEQVVARFDQGSVDADVKLEANELLAAIADDLDQVRSSEGYHDFLLWYAQRARERFLRDDDADGPTRSDPLCTCRDTHCELKRGQLPVTVRTAENYDRGIQLFSQEHDGEPTALTDAQAAWRSKVARVRRALGIINTSLSSKTKITEMDVDLSPFDIDESSPLFDAGEADADAEAVTAD